MNYEPVKCIIVNNQVYPMFRFMPDECIPEKYDWNDITAIYLDRDPEEVLCELSPKDLDSVEKLIINWMKNDFAGGTLTIEINQKEGKQLIFQKGYVAKSLD